MRSALALWLRLGRGLLLVTALAGRWGVEPYPPGGKTVWAECTRETPDPAIWMVGA